MSEDIYAKPDLNKKVRFQTEEDIENVTIYDNSWALGSTPPKSQDDDTEDQKAPEFYVNVESLTIYANPWSLESTPPKPDGNINDEKQPPKPLDSINEDNRPPDSLDNRGDQQPPKSQDVTDDKKQNTSVKVSPEKRNLHGAAAVLLGLLCLFLLMAVIVVVVLSIQGRNTWNSERKRQSSNIVNLTRERDELQTSNSEFKNLNRNLTSEIDLLKADKNNLKIERDDLKRQIEATCCTEDWMKFDGSCYLVVNQRKNWRGSQNFCKTRGSDLLIISSLEEQRFFTLFQRLYWIGLTDEETEGVWKWVDGTEATRKYWRGGQPDNYQQRENCVLLSRSAPQRNWNDVNCNALNFFICEKSLQ